MEQNKNQRQGTETIDKTRKKRQTVEILHPTTPVKRGVQRQEAILPRTEGEIVPRGKNPLVRLNHWQLTIYTRLYIMNPIEPRHRHRRYKRRMFERSFHASRLLRNTESQSRTCTQNPDRQTCDTCQSTVYPARPQIPNPHKQKMRKLGRYALNR